MKLRTDSRACHWALLLAFLLTCFAPAGQAQTQQPQVFEIKLHDTLQGERAGVFAREMEEGNRGSYDAILIDLSTPGGLSSVADEMVAAIRASRVPVIVWVGVPRTRVSGEGLRLLAAGDIALMDPKTFLTPLWTDRPHRFSAAMRAAGSERLHSTLEGELLQSGRSPRAAADLSAGSHWFSADEDVAAGLVEGVAEGEEAVFRAATGRLIHRNGRNRTLRLMGARLQIAAVAPQELLLLRLMNPDLSVLLLTLGLLLIYLEVNTPGTVIPGAAGILLVLLASYALHMLPLSIGGVLLCLLAALFLLLEARLSAHGVLALLGIVALVFGLVLLVAGPLPQLQVGWGTAVGAGIGFGGMTSALIILGVEARRAKIKTGSEAMLGWLAVAQTELAPEGHVLVRGELWRARLISASTVVAAGEHVKVLRATGSTLEVTAVPLT